MQSSAIRTPKQDRSKRTVGFIIDATTQLLIEDGYAAISTNRIAKRAGVSVGTVYQYFANKEQIIEAVAQQHFDRTSAKVLALIEAGTVESAPNAVRAVVRACIDVFAEDPTHFSQFFEHFDRIILSIADKSHERLENVLMGVLIGEGRPASDAFMRSRIAVRAFTGIIRSTLRREPMLVRDPGFADALEELIGGYINPG